MGIVKERAEEVKPFLRWIGGKQRSIESLADYLPRNLPQSATYYEPFLGAGSLFFHLRPKLAVLSDRNQDLIDCYQAIKDNPALVARYLREHRKASSEDYYYQVRRKYNRASKSFYRAATFIYLNKTCFNGIWRVNTRGEFNVPYGHKEHPAIPSAGELAGVSRVLKNAKLLTSDFEVVTKKAKKGDLIYFDPPYPPLNGTSYFTHYTKERFSTDDHSNLAAVAQELSSRGCYVIISNSGTEYIRSLYEQHFRIHNLEVIRWVRADGIRYRVEEIAITNYKI